MHGRQSIGRWIGLLIALVMLPGPHAAAQNPTPPIQPGAAPPSLAASPLRSVRSWGYQLQGVSPAEIAASPFDLVVVDYSRNGVDAGRFTADEVKTMRTKPDGGRRIVLAYMSIGEAEDYRFYWQPSWVEPAPLKRDLVAPTPSAGAAPATGSVPATVRIPRLVAPGWLGRENEIWSGNYLVRFWYDGWQNLIMHYDTSYLARIQAAGFDGVYLDRVDAYYASEVDWRESRSRMIDFVVELAAIARKRRPGFLVVPQNAEELLREPRYVAAIDAVAKEDLFLAATAEPNAPETVAGYLGHLGHASAAGKPVLVVEYTANVDAISTLAGTARTHGIIPYFGTRTLDRLTPQPAAGSR